MPLRRLIGQDIGPLLEGVTAAMPGLGVALIDEDGDVVTWSGAWPGQLRRSFDLTPRDKTVGTLAWVGEAPEPLIEGLAASLSALLRERLDKHDLARETLDRYREINLLYRASETIGASLDATELPRLLLAETERVIVSDAAAVLIGNDVVGDSSILVSAATLVAAVTATGRPDIASDEQHSALCVPLRAGENVLGVMVLGRTVAHAKGSAALRPLRPFTAGDEKLLLGLASQAGLALERARLHQQETHRQRLEQELAVAHRIQLSLLPSHPPVIPGWTFAATYQAAREVGGDFYDFLDHVADRRSVGLVIADVTGKGVPAALMMAYSRAVVRAESMAGRSPTEVLTNTNRLLLQERQTRLFLSACYAELDLDDGRLTYANAGHDAPLWISASGDQSIELEDHGTILGAFQDIGLETREIALGAGDTVVFYTDGVTEARDGAGRLFGDERLSAAAVGAVSAGGDAEAVLRSIVGAVESFTVGAEQADDLTIVVVQREGG
jgi:serine phosphatase RsbU (regulator of sigma subunit)